MNNLWISLRNLLFLLLVIIITLTSVEYYLSIEKKRVQSDPADEQYYNSIDMMCFERSPTGFLSTSKLAEEYLKLSDNRLTIKHPAAYPLITDLQEDRHYDDNVKTILVVGDSFVWGDGSTNRNELFWLQLEQSLRKQGYNCRVVGVGMIGATAYEELRWIRETDLLQTLHPDMILFGYVYNDAVLDNQLDEKDSSSLREHLFMLDPFRSVFPNLFEHLFNYIDAKTLYNKKYGIRHRDAAFCALDDEIYDAYRHDFVEPLSDLSTQKSIPVAVATLPIRPGNILMKELYQPLTSLYADIENINFYDLFDDYTDYFKFQHRDCMYVNPYNGHPGSAAQHFYAKSIEAFLKADYPQVLGEPVQQDLTENMIRINECMPPKLQLQRVQTAETLAEYTLEYPSEIQGHMYYHITINPYYLYFPIRESHIMLSFDHPISMSSVEIYGEKLENASVYYNRIHETYGYDDYTVFPLTRQSAKKWTCPSSDLVSSLRIHADMIGRDGGKLTIVIHGKESG